MNPVRTMVLEINWVKVAPKHEKKLLPPQQKKVVTPHKKNFLFLESPETCINQLGLVKFEKKIFFDFTDFSMS